MKFNLWRHIRLAACVSLFCGSFFHNFELVWLGLMLVMSGLVGGLDLAERQIEILINKGESNEKAETPKSH